MLRWLKSLFAWRPVRNTGVWLYEENEITGQRCATEIGSCWQPLNHSFMRKGDLVRCRNGRYVIGSDDEIRYSS